LNGAETSSRPALSTLISEPVRAPSGKFALSHSRVPSVEQSSTTMMFLATPGSARLTAAKTWPRV
jgi:hypothetical protein